MPSTFLCTQLISRAETTNFWVSRFLNFPFKAKQATSSQDKYRFPPLLPCHPVPPLDQISRMRLAWTAGPWHQLWHADVTSTAAHVPSRPDRHIWCHILRTRRTNGEHTVARLTRRATSMVWQCVRLFEHWWRRYNDQLCCQHVLRYDFAMSRICHRFGPPSSVEKRTENRWHQPCVEWCQNTGVACATCPAWLPASGQWWPSN